jgi:hypothetical protein
MYLFSFERSQHESWTDLDGIEGTTSTFWMELNAPDLLARLRRRLNTFYG